MEEIEASNNTTSNNVEEPFYKKVLVYILALFLFLVILLSIYFSTHYEFITKNELANKYMKIQNVQYDNLPINEQDKYILKEECPVKYKIIKDPQSVALENKLFKLTNSTKVHNQQNDILLAKQKIKIIDLTKTVNLLNNNKYNKIKYAKTIKNQKVTIKILNKKLKKLKKFKNKKNKIKIVKQNVCNDLYEKSFVLANFVGTEDINTHLKDKVKHIDSIMCNDMPKGKSYISKECFASLSKFVLKNKNANYFEVIGLFGKNEKYTDSKKLVLSHKRVREIIWQLRLDIKFKTKVFPVNYTVTSKKHSKGVIIKAYN